MVRAQGGRQPEGVLSAAGPPLGTCRRPRKGAGVSRQGGRRGAAPRRVPGSGGILHLRAGPGRGQAGRAGGGHGGRRSPAAGALGTAAGRSVSADRPHARKPRTFRPGLAAPRPAGADGGRGFVPAARRAVVAPGVPPSPIPRKSYPLAARARRLPGSGQRLRTAGRGQLLRGGKVRRAPRRAVVAQLRRADRPFARIGAGLLDDLAGSGGVLPA